MTHMRRYVGVSLTRDGDVVELPFAEPVHASCTKTPGWVLKDRRRAANKRARIARRAARRCAR